MSATDAGAQHHARPLRFLETAQRRGDGVGAGAQVRKLEEPLCVGLGFPRDAGRFVGDDDGRAGDDCLLRIEDRSPNGAERGLRGKWNSKGGRERNGQREEKDRDHRARANHQASWGVTAGRDERGRRSITRR